ncbi:nuclease-related domain-containing protein [Nocardia testacea]|uniref:nuclease-related domain-containing protein n=1 Tax=Nocardia testacea TaxID=248551 RepID=UPI0033DF999D
MLIIANKPKSGAEERVLEWLKGWVGKYKIPGIAITNAYVAGQEVDLLVITPHTTVAVEIKGTAPGVPTDGVLICTSNRRWEVPGFTGDPVLVRTKDITPYEQARDGALKLKSVVNQVGGTAYVRALVVVVPPRRSNMRLEKKSAPDGCHVLLCENHSPLRAYFHGAHSQGDIVWTAEQAYALIDALESGDRTTIDELAVEGFPRQQDNPLPAAPPPVSRPVSSRPTAPVLPPPAAPRPPAPPQPDRIAGLGRRPAESAPRPVITRPSAQTSAGRRGAYQTAAAFAAIAVIGGGLWLLTSSDGDTDPQEVGNQHPLSSVVEEPAPLPAPPTAEAPPPPPAPAPAPPAGVTGCFPFQPNC